MQALQISHPRAFQIVDLPPCRPAPDEVVIELEYAAICNQNDAKIFYGEYGDLISYPCAPGVYGHEGCGLITELGRDVTDFDTGDRVVLMLDGGPMLYRESVTRKAGSVARIDRSIPAQQAAILELFGCAHHCVQLTGDLQGKTVGISGLGPAGLALLQLLRLHGPGEIVGVEIAPGRAQAAERAGLARVVSPEDTEAFAALVDEGLDVVFDTTGCPSGILNAFELTRKEVMVFGFTNTPFAVDQSKWFQKEMVIRNSRNQTVEDLRAVVALLEQGRIETGSFVSDIMPFSAYDKAVERVRDKEAIKVLLSWNA